MRLRETRDAFARQDSAENVCFCLAMVPSVSPKTERAPAKVMTVSRESPAASVGDTTSALTQKSHIISLGHFLRTSQNIAIPTIRIHGLKYLQGNYVRNCWDKATHQHSQRRRCGGRRRAPRVRRAWLRCPWAAAGPGRASSRRAERSSLRGRLAGGPPPTGTPSSPAPQPGPPAPATPAAPHDRAGTPKGRVPQYPPPCRLTQPLPRRGSGRMILSPGDGDASTGTYRPRRPLPGPPRRSGRRSRCAQGAGSGRCSAWWPGRRARRNRSSRR